MFACESIIRPQTADRRPQTADRRPQTADLAISLSFCHSPKLNILPATIGGCSLHCIDDAEDDRLFAFTFQYSKEGFDKCTAPFC